MAKVNNRYIQFYTPGTAAVKVQIQNEHQWAPLPEPAPVKRTVVYVDPVAIVSFLVAVCMVILMAVGINQLNESRREVAAMEHYVAQLTAQNQRLTQQYAEGYDLDVVRQKALDMGMVPVEQIPVEHIYVTLPPAPEPEPATAWEQMRTYLVSLFA